MLLKNKVTGEIFPYNDYLFNMDKYAIYEPLITSEPEELVDAYEEFREALKHVPKFSATKDFVETTLERLFTDKEYKNLIARIYG